MNTHTPDNDVNNWLKQFLKTSDNRYWGYIFEKYKKIIYIKCHNFLTNEDDALDATSEAFIKAFTNIKSFDLQRPFLPWIIQIATNICIDAIRKKNRIQFTQIENAKNITNFDNPSNKHENAEIKDHLKQAIRNLPTQQKRCFCLFYVQQRSYKEIAELTGYPHNEVRSHIQNSRRKVRLILRNLGE